MTEHAHTDSPTPVQGRPGKGGHGWLMMLCCIPMVIIAVALVVSGTVNPGFLVVTGLCVGMMALMMRAMGSMPER